MSENTEDTYNGMSRYEFNDTCRKLMVELLDLSKRCGEAGVPCITAMRIPVLSQPEEQMDLTRELITKQHPEIVGDLLEEAMKTAETTQVVSGLNGFHSSVLGEIQMSLANYINQALEKNAEAVKAAIEDSDAKAFHIE